MKKFRFALMALAAVVLASCDPGNDPSPEPTPDTGSITIASSQDLNPVFDDAGGTKGVTFTASAAWSASLTITKAGEWISVSPTSGSKGENTVKFTVTANSSNEARAAVIKLVCGKDTKTINVSQVQNNAIVVAPASIEAKAEGDAISLKIGHNVPYTVDIDGKDWITQTKTKAFTEETLSFSIAPNGTGKTRTGKITFTSTDKGVQQIVSISQAALKGKKIKSITKKYEFSCNQKLQDIADLYVVYVNAENKVSAKEKINTLAWSTAVKVTNITKATATEPITNGTCGVSIFCSPNNTAGSTDVYDLQYTLGVSYDVEYEDGTTEEYHAIDINPDMPGQEGKYDDEETNAISLSCTADADLVVDDQGNIYIDRSNYWEENDGEYQMPPGQVGDIQVPPTTPPEPGYPDYDYVDLGFTVTGKPLLWATRNIGARSNSDLGGLYGWGDASGYHCEAQHAFYPARNPKDVLGSSAKTISGTRVDIAYAQWGPNWRMPSKAEWEALAANCNYEFKQEDGNWGCKFTSKINGNSIFLPAADERYIENYYRDSKSNPKTWNGFYWAGDIYPTDSQLAYYFYFQPNAGNVYKSCQGNKDRYFGHSVRAVRNN